VKLKQGPWAQPEWAAEGAWRRRSERTTTHEVVDHSWSQEVQKLRVAQWETPEPRVARQVSVWLHLAQWGMTGPREAQQASSRPHEAEIPEGLPVWAEEPQGARSPGEPPRRAGRPP
jgi:hypothetical protein